MIGTELVVGFDYSEVTANVAAEMREAADRVRGLIRASVVEVGRELLAVKQQLEHGQFVTWVERECRLPIRAAQRAMRAAEMVGKNDKLSYLPPDGLLALASPSTAAEPIVTEIIGRIEAGDRPSAAEIKRRIAAARDEAKALRAGAQARDEMRSPSPDAELAALIDVWDRAGGEAREAFLARIGVAPIVQAAQQPVARSELPATTQERFDKGAITPTVPIEPMERRLEAQPDEPEIGAETVCVGSSAETSRVLPPKVGGATQIEPSEHPVAAPNSPAALSGPGDDRPFAEVIAKHERAPDLTCRHKNGCRYSRCAADGRCLFDAEPDPRRRAGPPAVTDPRSLAA